MSVRFQIFHRGIVLAILLTASYSASAFYDPTIGAWVSRDPIGETGGPNVYGLVQNNPVTLHDPLGLSCGGKCGVISLRAINDGWTVTPNWIAFKFHVMAKFKKGNGYDPLACKVVQWVQDRTTINGVIQPADGNPPTDGRLHVDRNPYLPGIGDDITNPAIYDRENDYDVDPADDVFTAYDTPTRGGANGDQLGGDLRFRIVVYDASDHFKKVASTQFGIYWHGIWPSIDHGVE